MSIAGLLFGCNFAASGFWRYGRHFVALFHWLDLSSAAEKSERLACLQPGTWGMGLWTGQSVFDSRQGSRWDRLLGLHRGDHVAPQQRFISENKFEFPLF